MMRVARRLVADAQLIGRFGRFFACGKSPLSLAELSNWRQLKRVGLGFRRLLLCEMNGEDSGHSNLSATTSAASTSKHASTLPMKALRSSVGSGLRVSICNAFFPEAKRLVIDEGGRVATYDTGEHVLSGVSQQQGGTQTITFSSAKGPVPLFILKRLSGKEW